MRFVETSVFTRQITAQLDGDDYRGLQNALLLRPQAGPVIRNSGGLRKIRWGREGSGKRGGIRVVYYWDPATETFFMLFAYPKSIQDDLSDEQLKVLRQVVRQEFP